MPKRYVVALDQGTTSSRAMLVDAQGRVVDAVQNPFPQIYPRPGWVEHDPRDILSSQLGALTELLVSSSLAPDDIDSIGITNQRETTIVWNRETGEPVYNAIVWQCRRTAPIIEELAMRDPGVARVIRPRPASCPMRTSPASKIEVDPRQRARARARRREAGRARVRHRGQLAHLVAHAGPGARDRRDQRQPHHAVRHPRDALGSVAARPVRHARIHAARGAPFVRRFRPSRRTPACAQGVPICGVAGDQQAALFGQCCFEAGQAKNTYGTGCFLLMHTGFDAVPPRSTAWSPPSPLRRPVRRRARIRARGQRVRGRRAHAVAARRAGHHCRRCGRDRGALRAACPTPAAYTWCLRSPGWAPRTGIPRRAEPSYGLTRGTTPGAHRARGARVPGLSRWHDLARGHGGGCRRAPSSALNVDGGASGERFSACSSKATFCAHASAPSPEYRKRTGARRGVPGRAFHGLLEGCRTLCATLRASDTVFEPCMDDARHARLLESWARVSPVTMCIEAVLPECGHDAQDQEGSSRSLRKDAAHEDQHRKRPRGLRAEAGARRLPGRRRATT